MNTIGHLKVLFVEQRMRRRWTGGIGGEAVFAEEKLGWFVGCENNVTFCVGHGNPRLEAGDILAIVKVDNGKSGASVSERAAGGG